MPLRSLPLAFALALSLPLVAPLGARAQTAPQTTPSPFVDPSGAAAAPPAAGPAVIVVGAPTAPVTPPGAYFHDGFYARLALGGGGLVDDFSGVLWAHGEASGGSGAAELMIGGSLAPGVVLGGGLLAEQVISPNISIGGVDSASNVGVGTFLIAGVFVDWYPNPARGFHLQALAGGARIDITDSSGVRSDNQPIGGGLALGGGYEWWIGREWSLGILGRLSGGTMADQGVTHRVGAVSVLASITYN